MEGKAVDVRICAVAVAELAGKNIERTGGVSVICDKDASVRVVRSLANGDVAVLRGIKADVNGVAILARVLLDALRVDRADAVVRNLNFEALVLIVVIDRALRVCADRKLCGVILVDDGINRMSML